MNGSKGERKHIERVKNKFIMTFTAGSVGFGAIVKAIFTFTVSLSLCLTVRLWLSEEEAKCGSCPHALPHALLI